MLTQAGLDPTIVVGGEVNAWQGNARIGQSQYLVAEADESDGSLVKHSPKIGIITNIELDHPDHFLQGTKPQAAAFCLPGRSNERGRGSRAIARHPFAGGA